MCTTPVYRETAMELPLHYMVKIFLLLIKTNVYILMSFTVSKLADHGS